MQKRKRVTFILSFFLFISQLSAQKKANNSSLDHAIFIDKITNSQDIYFNEVIQFYDDYLLNHSHDVAVHLEKCRFINLAQYDDYNDYNPNQNLFDSISEYVFKKFPNHPDILIYQTEVLWGEEYNEALVKAEKAIDLSTTPWSDENLGRIYSEIANKNYIDESYDKAYQYAKKTLAHDEKYGSTLSYAQILKELGRTEEAIIALSTDNDTTQSAWELNQKAKLLVELDGFNQALALYNLVNQIDSNYNNNQDLAVIMNNINEHNEARRYLLKDTSGWDKNSTAFSLYTHDLEYHGGDTAVLSYNHYRDLGYSNDPAALHRLKLFLHHPFAPVKARDFLGLLTLLLILIILVLVPSIFILPIYFVGHRWKLITSEKIKNTIWGLKSFWWVSAGYFIASFISLMPIPDYINAWINWTEVTDNYTEDDNALSILLFMIAFAFFGITILYKVNLKILLYKYCSFWKCIGLTISWFIGYKIVSSIYMLIAMKIFGLSIDQLTTITHQFLSATLEIKTLISSYGILASFLIVCVLVPIYEELIFRGVIFSACKRYFNFRWANALQAILFASIHLDLTLFPIFVGFGLIAGILQKKTGGLMSGILFHMINNSIAMMFIISKS